MARLNPALLAATASLGLGFVVMATASYLTTSPSPGMWRYWSGTVGDLLLPVIIYGLTRGVILLPGTGVPRSTVIAGVCGGLLGGASQLAWLLDPSPRLNWMLVRPHTFSWIGWYHALFLIVVSGYIAGATWELLRRARAHPESATFFRGNGCALVLSSGSVFVLTVVADSLPSAVTSSSRATIAAVVLAPFVMLLVTWVTLGRGMRLVLGPVFVALTATVAAACAVRGFQMGVPSVVIAILSGLLTGIGLSGWFYRPGPFLRSSNVRLLWPPFLCVAAVSSVVLIPAGMWQPLAVAAGLVCVAVVICVVARDHGKAFAPAAQALSTSTLVLVIAGLSITLVGTNKQELKAPILLVTVLFSALLGKAAIHLVQDVWQTMVDDEKLTSADGTPAQGLAWTRARTWIGSVAAGMGAFLPLVLVAMQATESTVDLGRASPSAHEVLWAGIGTTVALAAGLPAIASMFDRKADFPRDVPQRRRVSGVARTLSGMVGLAVLAGVAVVLAAQIRWQGIVSVIAILVVIVAVVDTYWTVVIDSTLLCFRDPGPVDRLIGGVCAASGGLILYWALLGGAANGSVKLHLGLLVFVAGIVMRCVLVSIAAGLIYGRGRYAYATLNPIWWNQVQNEVTRALLLIVTAWFPFAVYTHSTSDQWMNAAMAAFVVLWLMVPVFTFASRRFMEHVQEQHDLRFSGRFSDPMQPTEEISRIFTRTFESVQRYARWRRTNPDRPHDPLGEEEFMRALSAGIGFQTFARGVLVAVTLTGLAVMVMSAPMAYMAGVAARRRPADEGAESRGIREESHRQRQHETEAERLREQLEQVRQQAADAVIAANTEVARLARERELAIRDLQAARDELQEEQASRDGLTARLRATDEQAARAQQDVSESRPEA